MEERDAELSQAYREADHPRPGAALDARILEAARQSVVRPAVRGRSRWFTWALPLSTAAVVILGITVLLEIQLQAPEYLEPPTGTISADRAEAGAPPEPLPAEPTVRLPYQAPTEAMPRTEAADSVEPVPRAMVRAPQRVQESTPDTVSAASRERAPVNPWATAPATPEPQPFPAQPGMAPAAPPTPAAKAESRPAPQAEARAAQDAAEASSNLAGQSGAMMSAPPPASAVAPSRESMPAFSQAKRKAAAPAAEGPEDMVETIRRLLREGRVDEARKELEKLRRTNPGYVLPDDLKGL